MPALPSRPISRPCPMSSAQIVPTPDSTSPMPTISVPPSTVQRTPMRSANNPMAMPPDPVPNQTSAAASDGIARGTSSVAAIGFSATATINGAPYVKDSKPSTMNAMTQEVRVSMLSAVAVLLLIWCVSSGGACVWPPGRSLAEHRRDVRLGDVLDSFRLPARLAVLVHDHCAHALDEVAVAHCCVGQGELGVEALLQRAMRAFAHYVQRPGERGGGDGAERLYRLARPVAVVGVQAVQDFGHAVGGEDRIDGGALGLQREVGQRHCMAGQRSDAVLGQRGGQLLHFRARGE